MERERFSSRLGFILISAGCAIGLGNVWRFPYITGKNGGAAFVLLYLFFLLILGLPVMVSEFAVGRGSRKSIARSFQELEPKGTYWHLHSYTGIVGNYLLMMFYTTIAGWMPAYFVRMAKGDFDGRSAVEVGQMFSSLTSSAGEMTFWMILIVVFGFLVCSLGLQNGVERITKIMMVCLLALMLLLAVRSVTLPGASEGLKFYLFPNPGKMKETGISQVVFEAMGQAFFTLSIGMGGMAIFGSHIGKEHSLCGESLNIMLLDTFVALVSGLIIFPTCFAFGINPGEGPGLVFVTLPNIFNEMAGGRIWGSLFFVFMTFAAMSTVIGVFQNIIAFAHDLWGWSAKKASFINCILVILLSMPCILGMTVWSSFTVIGKNIMDLEDFFISNNLMPIGSLIYVLFCVTRYGWGWDRFIGEANTGDGLKLPQWIRPYMTFGIPVIILFIFFQGYWNLLK